MRNNVIKNNTTCFSRVYLHYLLLPSFIYLTTKLFYGIKEEKKSWEWKKV